MKKQIAAVCAAALMLSAVGCGQTEETSVEQLLNEELSGEITVSCYDTMMYKASLEAAAKSFEAKNPGTKINIETFAAMPEIKRTEKDGAAIAMVSKEDDSQDRTEYINKINTELMSGKGADVLAMDILPWYKYADGGQLEDLQKYMGVDDSFNLDDYRENIIDALKYKGGQYIMPMDYNFDFVAYDSSLFTEAEQQKMLKGGAVTYDQIVKAAEAPYERVNADSAEPKRMFGASAYSRQQASMFKEMLQREYETFIDIENKKANLTDGSFEGLLETLKAYRDKGYLQPNADSSERLEIRSEDLIKQKEEQFFYKIKSHFAFLTEALKEAGLKIMVSFGNMSAGNEDHDKTLGLLANENGDIGFTYRQAYGINSNSDNKALAWAFIKYLMGEEMQTSLDIARISLPINNAARMEKAKMDITGASFSRSSFNGQTGQKGELNTSLNQDPGQNASGAGLNGSPQVELTESQQAALDQYVKTIEDFSDLLNYCPIEDETVNMMIDEEVARCFNGSKTAAEAAETLQEKIELYLNE